jgi:peroxiredoxin Q/BCP
VGVSPDSIKSHAKFATKYDLPFILLADTEKVLLESLGLWIEKSMYGKKYMGVDRTTILVSGDGTIVEVWRKVKVDGHAAEVLSSLNQLTAAR